MVCRDAPFAPASFINRQGPPHELIIWLRCLRHEAQASFPQAPPWRCRLPLRRPATPRLLSPGHTDSFVWSKLAASHLTDTHSSGTQQHVARADRNTHAQFATTPPP
eukprot:363161-Chlamydomonas_euryale.AAC.3